MSFLRSRRMGERRSTTSPRPSRRLGERRGTTSPPSPQAARPRTRAYHRRPKHRSPLTADDETVRRESVWPKHVPRDPARHTPPPPPLPRQALANDDKTQPLAAPWLTPAPLPKEEQTSPYVVAWPATPRADEKTEPGFSLFTESDTQRDQKKN